MATERGLQKPDTALFPHGRKRQWACHRNLFTTNFCREDELDQNVDLPMVTFRVGRKQVDLCPRDIKRWSYVGYIQMNINILVLYKGVLIQNTMDVFVVIFLFLLALICFYQKFAVETDFKD